MRTVRRFISFFLIVAIIIAGFLLWQLFGPTVVVPRSGYMYIRTGATYQDVKDTLTKNETFGTLFIFDRAARYLKYNQSVRPGRYRITKGMSMFNLLRMLRSGKQAPVNLVITKLRIREDLAKKIGERFEQDSATAIAFINNADTLSAYNLDTNTVLTAIIPNTYTFTWNTPVSKIFRRLYAENGKFWNAERKARATSLGLSEKEVYILASIVEEETNRQDDKGKIASVYLNRMRTGMRLSADPTVKFAMRDFGLTRIYFKHLAYPSPYNTYLISGLPPGPICTPSIKTIDAVLKQPQTDFLFFVAKPDFSGYSNFSAGYEEHKRNAKAYQVALDSLFLSNQRWL